MSVAGQKSKPMHIENSVMQLGKQDLSVNNAFNTYREMKYDGVISGSMSFIKSLVSKGGMKIVAHKDANTKEKNLTEALNQSLEDLVYDKKQLLSNWCQSLDYGCSLNEVVFKREKGSGYMVFNNISPIHLSNVNQFVFDSGRLVRIELNQAENDGLIQDVNANAATVDGEKILFFRIEPDSDFPLGKSLLYGAYTAWKTKKILQEYEAIGVAKNLSGVLDIQVPSEYINKYFENPNSAEGVYLASLIQQAEMLHAGKGSYILSASDTNSNGVRLFNITTVGGSGGNAQNYNVGQAIARYNQEIQLSLQTMVLSLGAEGGGSFALSDNSTYLMTLFVENIRNVFKYEFNKAIKQAFKLNGMETDKLPTLEFEEIEPIEWESFTRGWQRLIQSGGVTPTKELESFLRDAGGAPEANYKEVLDTETRADPSDRLTESKDG